MKILVVGNNFSGYDEQIAAGLRRLGFSAEVFTYKGILPSDYKFAFRIKSLLFYYLGRALSFRSRLKFSWDLRRRIDEETRLLVINGGFLLPSLLGRDVLSRSSVWLMDPVFRFPQVKRIFRSFGSRFTYDSRYLECLRAQLLPLFADEAVYDNSPSELDSVDDYLFAFVGAMNCTRMRILDVLAKVAAIRGAKVYFGGVFGQLDEAKKLFLSGEFPDLSQLFVEKKHSHREINDAYRKAKVIVNFHAANHTAYSMRTFEALILGKHQIIDIFHAEEFPTDSFPEAFLHIPVGLSSVEVLEKVDAWDLQGFDRDKARVTASLGCRLKQLLSEANWVNI